MGNCGPSAETTGIDAPGTLQTETSETFDDTTTSNSKQSEEQQSLPKGVETQVKAKKQRRRLSVAPNQVGQINLNSKSETGQRRASVVSASHLDKNIEPKKFVAISKKGFVPYNPNKVNQDSYFCDYNFGKKDDNNIVRLFGVCDGHGEKGHLVSQLVAKKLPKYLSRENYISDPVNAIKRTCKKVSDTLRKSKINTSFSGTTLVFSLIVNDTIYTGNLGDSRGILAVKNYSNNNNNENDSKNNNNNNNNNEDDDDDIDSNGYQYTLDVKELSFDHKPDLPEEKERILNNGGRVAPLPGPVGEDTGPMRVWLADIDVPGLAMSRSLGDDVAHTVGVSDIPEVTINKIEKDKDYFMIWASDGIWEFLDNKYIVNLINNNLPNLRECALKTVKAAISRWKNEEEVVDDITAVIFNLHEALKDDKKN
jgi:serine/threonine protein phosphatase PrpC